MSLPRAPNPFCHSNRTRHYSRLACQISRSAIPHCPNRIRTASTFTRHEPPNRTANRLFHTTPSHPAARAPKIRRAENSRSRAPPTFSDDGLYQGGVSKDIPARLQALEESGPKLWSASIMDGFLDEDVDRKTFMRVARAVLWSAQDRGPSAAAIRDISTDPNLVFKIGHIVSINSPSLAQWVISSTAQAGAIIPTLISAARALAKADSTFNTSAVAANISTSVPPRTPIFEKIAHLAHTVHDPRAMLIQAKLLGQQKRYNEALHLVESVMRMIYPSKVAPPTARTMSIPNLETPWAIYTWLKRCTGASEYDFEAQEILKTAALEYQDPAALITYAGQMMAQHDLAKYEECMSKAATAGNATACRKLANFYYLTSKGRFPRRGSNSSDPVGDFERAHAQTASQSQPYGKLVAFLSSLFGPQPYHEYRGLAIEWYELAFRHGCPKAALALAILMRENGEDKEAVAPVFQYVVASSNQLGGWVRPFRVNWEREDYVPTVPGEVLDV